MSERVGAIAKRIAPSNRAQNAGYASLTRPTRLMGGGQRIAILRLGPAIHDEVRL